MNRKKKAAAVALAAAMACGTLAGCDALTTTNVTKDYAQIIAEVNLSQHKDFREGDYKDYAGLVSDTVKIMKRDMVASFISSGYSLQQQYGWTYADTFKTIAESLVSRQVYVQFAKVFLVENGDADGHKYSIPDYQAYVTAHPSDNEDERVSNALSYFLTEEERMKADYDLMASINGAIDSIEEGIIELSEDGNSSTTASSDVRTLPTGAETENADYYPVKTVNNGQKALDYAIYTGRESATELGEYEKVEGSLTSTRKKAYVQYLSNLASNDLVRKGEDTSDMTKLSYYFMQRRASYESAIINKLTDKLEKNAELSLDRAWAEKEYQNDLENAKSTYGRDRSAFETAFDAISDSSFVLAPYDENYGYVINILLPFSDLQTQQLGEVSDDFGDGKGNSFSARTQLLRQIKATDQRSTWFTGETDYSYDASSDTEAFTGDDADRKYLFFENSFSEEEEGGAPAKYERLKNYFGKYTYNGTVEKQDKDGDTEYTFTPNKINIDDFLKEMKDYMKAAGVEVEAFEGYDEQYRTAYFGNEEYYFTAEDEAAGLGEEGDVNYNKFIYDMGKVKAFNTEDSFYDANQIFLPGTKENIALSVINELSFAYNTDTAGLNTYLGYSISPYKTSYMSEFEFAAQLAVKNGAGTYVVVPTDYGWHIIYCTFSFADAAKKGTDAFRFVYEDDDESDGKVDRTVEGTFSYNYFEALKATVVSQAATNMQTEYVNRYIDDCSEIFESRFADLMRIGG